jgi:hypothetical protein
MIRTQHASDARPRHIWLMAICVSLVAISAFFDPWVGKCGTGPYVMFQLLGALLHTGPIVVNVAVFSSTVALLYLKGADFLPTRRPDASTSRTWFVPALLTWTVFYLASYFVLFPTTSCP